MQNVNLVPDSVLIPSKACVVREQGEGWLFYNSRTDELHLVPPAGVATYQLCDGLKTVGEINQILGECMGLAPESLRERLYGFLGQLVSRGILEVENNV